MIKTPVVALLDRGPRVGRFIRYAAGSVAASLVSAATLAVMYHGLALGPKVSSIGAFCAGALVNFVIYRFWAWRAPKSEHDPADAAAYHGNADLLPPSGRASVGREFGKYAIVAVCTAFVALATTSLGEAYARRIGADPTTRTLIVEGSYFGAFAVMFVAKFLILDRFVFTTRSSGIETSGAQPPDTLTPGDQAPDPRAPGDQTLTRESPTP